MKKIIIAGVLTSMLAASPVWAASTETASSSAAASASLQKEVTDAQNIATQGMIAMRDIRLARVAIFQGQPDMAKKLTADAQKMLADDSIDWTRFEKTDHKARMIDDKYVIINAAIAVSENYIATPEKEAAIKKANAKLAKGDKKGAVETLRETGIGIMENQELMPLNHTRHDVTEAQRMLNDGKYYEANLVLKNAEDAIVVESDVVVDR